jgi:hypothetical protein
MIAMIPSAKQGSLHEEEGLARDTTPAAAQARCIDNGVALQLRMRTGLALTEEGALLRDQRGGLKEVELGVDVWLKSHEEHQENERDHNPGSQLRRRPRPHEH